MEGKSPADPPYLIGCPEDKLASLSEYRRRQQTCDGTTREFVEFCESAPNLKAVLAGHLHRFAVTHLDSGVPQIICPLGAAGAMIEYEIV